MLEAFALSDKGCVRTNNEDCCLIESELGLYAVADGMGGARAGERASKMAVDTVAERLLLAPNRDSEALLSAVEEANRRVMDAARNDATLEGMGTTLVAALAIGNELIVASVGDSRAYLFDEAGLRQVTDDQTWVNEVGRPLGLDEESLKRHPMRHVLTMAIGAGSPLSINSYSVPMRVGSTVLMCSDGLHGVLEAPQIESLLKDGSGLEACCHALVAAAKEAGGPDNVTVVIVKRTR